MHDFGGRGERDVVGRLRQSQRVTGEQLGQAQGLVREFELFDLIAGTIEMVLQGD